MKKFRLIKVRNQLKKETLEARQLAKIKRVKERKSQIAHRKEIRRQEKRITKKLQTTLNKFKNALSTKKLLLERKTHKKNVSLKSKPTIIKNKRIKKKISVVKVNPVRSISSKLIITNISENNKERELEKLRRQTIFKSKKRIYPLRYLRYKKKKRRLYYVIMTRRKLRTYRFLRKVKSKKLKKKNKYKDFSYLNKKFRKILKQKEDSARFTGKSENLISPLGLLTNVFKHKSSKTSNRTFETVNNNSEIVIQKIRDIAIKIKEKINRKRVNFGLIKKRKNKINSPIVKKRKNTKFINNIKTLLLNYEQMYIKKKRKKAILDIKKDTSLNSLKNRFAFYLKQTKTNALKKKKLLLYKNSLRAKRLKKLKKQNLRLERRAEIEKEKAAEIERRKNREYTFEEAFILLAQFAMLSSPKYRRRKKKKRRKYRIWHKACTRLRTYPIAFYSFFVKNRYGLILPPSRKRFHLLKVLILSFKTILQSSFKRQFYFLSTLRQLLVSLLTLPAFSPKLFFLRQLNLFLIKETTFRHLNIFYFKKIFKSRFLIFQGAFTALVSSLKSFDKNTHIGVSFIGMHVRNVSAALVCNYILHKLGQYFTIQEILKPVVFDLRSSPNIDGFRLTVAGRLTRKERAAFMIRKNGKVTLSKKDARITYAAGDIPMRFGKVGVKVWFQIKKSKPYLYRVNFSLPFMVAFLTLMALLHTMDAIFEFQNHLMGNDNKNLEKAFILNMRNLWDKLKRGAGKMFPSSMGPNNPRIPSSSLPPTQQTPPPVLPEKQQTRDMATIIGKFSKESKHSQHTTSPNGEIDHFVPVDERVVTVPGFSHILSTFTSKDYAHKSDSTVTELAEFDDKRLDGKEGKQYLAGKDNLPHITKDDMPHFKKYKDATEEQDASYQRFLAGNAKYRYRADKLDIENNRVKSPLETWKTLNAEPNNNENKPLSADNNKPITHDKIIKKNETPTNNKNEES